MESMRDKILKYVKKHPLSCARDIYESIGIPQQALCRILKSDTTLETEWKLSKYLTTDGKSISCRHYKVR